MQKESRYAQFKINSSWLDLMHFLLGLPFFCHRSARIFYSIYPWIHRSILSFGILYQDITKYLSSISDTTLSFWPWGHKGLWFESQILFSLLMKLHFYFQFKISLTSVYKISMNYNKTLNVHSTFMYIKCT